MSQPYRNFTPEDRALSEQMAQALAQCTNIDSPAQRGRAYGRNDDLISKIAELQFQRFGALDCRALEIARSRASRTGERVAGVLIAPVMCTLVAAASLIDPAHAQEALAPARESLAWFLPPIFFGSIVLVLVILAFRSRDRDRAAPSCENCAWWSRRNYRIQHGIPISTCLNERSEKNGSTTFEGDACESWARVNKR